MKKINQKYTQAPSVFRNDIYRKFEKQFKYILSNPLNIDSDEYVEYEDNEYTDAFDTFLYSSESDIRFFVGFTGTGKTTFIKHYFGIKTLGIELTEDGSLVIPISWDGKKLPEDQKEAEKSLDEQIKNVIDAATKKIYKSVEELILTESSDIIRFIEKTRSDLLSSLSLEEIAKAQEGRWTVDQIKLEKCRTKNTVEGASSILKYAIENKQSVVQRIVFVVDDVETVAQKKLEYIVRNYFKIFSCLHNARRVAPVKLLFSIRPHSYRFLRTSLKHEQINAFGNSPFLQRYRLVKNKIPNIKEIFISRFEKATKNTPSPGNPTTWGIAKSIFYEIINDFDDNLIKMISELCHLNIRAITDCFQMILSNRVWCQEFETTSGYFTVRRSDYRFDIVNVVRTMACGENSVYTGMKEIQFNPSNLSDIQDRPILDNSKIFIPNLLIDVKTNECDVLPAIIVHYLDGFFSSAENTPPHTEFISKKTLTNDLYAIFGGSVSEEKITGVLDYLFENRVIRKSIISDDSDATINTLGDEDLLYLTLKGNRLLTMFENDSVLLEVFREDIKREYTDVFYRSSYELITQGCRPQLFEDLIALAEEIYHNEDRYQTSVANADNKTSFYPIVFPITQKIVDGIQNSLSRAQSIQKTAKDLLTSKLTKLINDISRRAEELN